MKKSITREGDPIAALSDSISKEFASFLNSVPLLKYFVPIIALFFMVRPGVIVVVLLTPASAAFLATSGFPPLYQSLLGALAISFAIASAHIFNDFCDIETDRLNPRTKWRPLPAGLVSRKSALAVSIIFAAVSLIFAFFLNWVCAILLVCGVALIFSYSAYLKRTVWGFLPPAFAAFLIPLGAFGAYNPAAAFSSPAIIMGFAGFFFELIPYWCQTFPDIEGDRARGIPTIAVKLGARKTSVAILLCYVLCMLFLLLLGKHTSLGTPYFSVVICGGILVALMVILLLIRPDGKRALGLYFISLIFIGAVALAIIFQTAYNAIDKYLNLGREVLDFLS
jgi:4-hydroxybenzoate polyprenyltransferase